MNGKRLNMSGFGKMLNIPPIHFNGEKLLENVEYFGKYEGYQ